MPMQKTERMSEYCWTADSCGQREYPVTRPALIISLLIHVFIAFFAPAAWLKSEKPPVEEPSRIYKINLLAIEKNTVKTIAAPVKAPAPIKTAAPAPVPQERPESAAVPFARSQPVYSTAPVKQPVAGAGKTEAAASSLELPQRAEISPQAEPRQPDLSGFIELFIRRLEEKKEYPYIARRRGQTGTVTLRVRLTAEGNLEEARVIKSSGFARLDEAAVKLITDVCPVVHGTGQALAITVPISYNLKEL